MNRRELGFVITAIFIMFLLSVGSAFDKGNRYVFDDVTYYVHDGMIEDGPTYVDNDPDQRINIWQAQTDWLPTGNMVVFLKQEQIEIGISNAMSYDNGSDASFDGIIVWRHIK